MANLDFKSKKIMQNTFFLHFSSFYFIFEKNNNNNIVWDPWMLCNANPRTKWKQRKQKQQREMVTKNREMKHKDHARKIQLDWAFCIQNFLHATLALVLLFILECCATPGLK